MSEPKPTHADRIQRVTLAIEAALTAENCAIIAVPTWKQDGRGGWYLDTHVQVVAK